MPAEKARTHYHPQSGKDVFGFQLVPGDKFNKNDVYDSTNGKWELCQCPGLTLGEGTVAVWVRPVESEWAIEFGKGEFYQGLTSDPALGPEDTAQRFPTRRDAEAFMDEYRLTHGCIPRQVRKI